MNKALAVASFFLLPFLPATKAQNPVKADPYADKTPMSSIPVRNRSIEPNWNDPMIGQPELEPVESVDTFHRVTVPQPIKADSVPVNTQHPGLEPAQDFFNSLDTIPGGPKIRAAYNTLPLPSDTIQSVTTADGYLTIIYGNGTMDEFHTKELQEPLAWFLRTYAPQNGATKKAGKSWTATMVRDRVHPANEAQDIINGSVTVIHYKDPGLTCKKNTDGTFTWSNFLKPGATLSWSQLKVNVPAPIKN